MFDTDKIRGEFPIMSQSFKVHGFDEPRKLIYFDHGASTHPPLRVLNKYMDFLKNYYSNVHRGKHNLSIISSELFDRVYEIIFNFISAESGPNAIVLTSNTTTALDIAANIMSAKDGVTLVSLMEHHSNDLPHRKYSKVVHFGINPDGSLDMADYERKLSENKVKLVAITAASNVTGFMPDIHLMAELAHKHGAKILVDAAQMLSHKAIDVKPNNDIEHIDFLAAAGHKAYSPFGSAFLFGPRDVMDEAAPYIPGGGTVLYVTDDDVYFDTSPEKHQGGTPNIGGAIALAESLRYLSEIGMDNIREHEAELTVYALHKLKQVPGIKILGNIAAEDRLGVVSFNIGELNNNLVSNILNNEFAIATRNGCFCAHPYLHRLLGLTDTTELRRMLVMGEEVELPGAVRLSLGIYNNAEEIDLFVEALKIISAGKWKADYEDFVPAASCKEIELSSVNR